MEEAATYIRKIYLGYKVSDCTCPQTTGSVETREARPLGQWRHLQVFPRLEGATTVQAKVPQNRRPKDITLLHHGSEASVPAKAARLTTLQVSHQPGLAQPSLQAQTHVRGAQEALSPLAVCQVPRWTGRTNQEHSEGEDDSQRHI